MYFNHKNKNSTSFYCIEIKYSIILSENSRMTSSEGLQFAINRNVVTLACFISISKKLHRIVCDLNKFDSFSKLVT